MFTTGHFIWLGAIAVAIALSLIAVKMLNVSYRTVGKIVMILLIVLKLFHMSLSMKE